MTEEVYAEVRARIDRHEAWLDTRRGRNGWASYRPEECPEDCRITNAERSSVEIHEFIRDRPSKYFAYVKGYDVKRDRWGGREAGELITWTGDKLGTITFGRRWQDSFGGWRVPVRVQAINGITYHGT